MNDIFEKVKSMVNIANVVELFGVKLDRSGKSCCPFHNEKTPSFSVKKSDNIYKCFGCGESGDSIDFAAKIKSIEPLEAAKLLAEIYGIDTQDHGGANRVDSLPVRNKISQQDVNTGLKMQVSRSKKESDTIKLRNKEYIRHCILNADKTDYFQKRGFTKDTVAKFFLGYDSDQDGIIIPYSSKLEYQITRLLSAPDPKKPYRKPPSKEWGSEPLYNVEAMTKNKGVVFVVESQLCAISVMQAGGIAIALGGTGGIRNFETTIRGGKNATIFVLSLDNDVPGQKAQQDLTNTLFESGVRFISYNIAGSCKDPNELLYFLITTAGTDRHSICYEVHRKAEDILRGKKHDSSFYPVIYGAADNDDWGSEAVWKKANPSLGVTVDISKLKTAYMSAKENPAEENLFRQLRLNQWVKQSIRWMPMNKWNKCAFPVDEEELYGRECYGGLDLASTVDISALVLVFPPRSPDEKYIVLPYFWLPEETLALRVRRDHVPYDIWEKKGKVMVTEGNVTHYEELVTFLSLLKDKFDIKEIAYDRWNSTQIVQNLTDAGFLMVPFGQGFVSMNAPSKELMKLVLEERLAHGGNEPLAWMADNVTVRTDPAGNIKPDKEKSTEKIDGIVALIMALDRAIKGGGGDESPYEHRGIIVL